MDGEGSEADYRNSIQGPRRKIKVAMRPEIVVNTGESTRRNYFPDTTKNVPCYFRATIFSIGLKALSHKGYSGTGLEIEHRILNISL